jgi:mRNA-degrading endonuclease toxin of MazEF toxin-antitoxin module
MKRGEVWMVDFGPPIGAEQEATVLRSSSRPMR